MKTMILFFFNLFSATITPVIPEIFGRGARVAGIVQTRFRVSGKGQLKKKDGILVSHSLILRSAMIFPNTQKKESLVEVYVII